MYLHKHTWVSAVHTAIHLNVHTPHITPICIPCTCMHMCAQMHNLIFKGNSGIRLIVTLSNAKRAKIKRPLCMFAIFLFSQNLRGKFIAWGWQSTQLRSLIAVIPIPFRKLCHIYFKVFYLIWQSLKSVKNFQKNKSLEASLYDHQE